MLSNLLVHIPSERPVRPVIDAAISLALARVAHLDAISIGYEAANVALAVDGGAAVAAVFGIEHEHALERAGAALAVFDTEARSAGIYPMLQALAGLPVEATAKACAAARLHDLTIVLQPDFNLNTHDSILPQEILFQSGGPVLFIPTTHKGPFAPRRVGIAWDGSRLAARAVRDAAPFLACAEVITIIAINEVRDPGRASAAALAAHLARRGLHARVERMTVDHADIQPAILSIAADANLDLIAMGGFGHSRMHERILGGVTRSMFESMTVPTLMSH